MEGPGPSLLWPHLPAMTLAGGAFKYSRTSADGVLVPNDVVILILRQIFIKRDLPFNCTIDSEMHSV